MRIDVLLIYSWNGYDQVWDGHISAQDWKHMPPVSFRQAIFLCVIRSSFLPGTATDSLRATIWAHIVQEVRDVCRETVSSFPVSELAAVTVQALSEYSYDAEIANCSYNLDIADGSVILTCFGRRFITYGQQAMKVPCRRG